MSPRKLNDLLSQARNLTKTFMAGGPESPDLFCKLLNLLLSLTVLQQGGHVRRHQSRGEEGQGVAIGGWKSPDDPLRLTNGRFLVLAMRVYIAPPSEKNYLKVGLSKIQYQLDQNGEQWVFRYEYIRHSPWRSPQAPVGASPPERRTDPSRMSSQ